MHPTLIKANIALFKGERGEVQRLLQSYRSEYHADDMDMVLWLEAQCQNEREGRIRKLYELIEKVDTDNHYAQMARAYLHEEEQYAGTKQVKRSSRAPYYIIATIVLIGLIFMAAAYFTDDAEPATEQAQPTAPIIEPTEITLVDRSQLLVAESYTARYDNGILQLTALEDRSERVISKRDDQLATPIPGARFFALKMAFECRSGICDQPPEAALYLQTENGDLISPRTDVYILNENELQAIALGRATDGWIIFEIPVLQRAQALVINPMTVDGQPVEPVVIDLPPTG